MLNKNDDSEYPCLDHHLGEKAFTFPTFSTLLLVGLLQWPSSW
jgi:hypothetical protein